MDHVDAVLPGVLEIAFLLVMHEGRTAPAAHVMHRQLPRGRVPLVMHPREDEPVVLPCMPCGQCHARCRPGAARVHAAAFRSELQAMEGAHQVLSFDPASVSQVRTHVRAIGLDHSDEAGLRPVQDDFPFHQGPDQHRPALELVAEAGGEPSVRIGQHRPCVAGQAFHVRGHRLARAQGRRGVRHMHRWGGRRLGLCLFQ
ncbi:hypothetical protein D9M68_741190 [compost metagenome]